MSTGAKPQTSHTDPLGKCVLQAPDVSLLHTNKETRVKIFTDGHSKGVEGRFVATIVNQTDNQTVPTVVSYGSRGIYIVSFTPQNSGNHVLDVRVDGVPIWGSPARFFVPGGTFTTRQSCDNLI